MPNPTTLSAVAVALLSALPAAQAGMYPKNSPVLQLDAKNYDRLVAKSNYTTIVEFYAPWCGHCQNLKPAYEKAAKNLEGLAHVAAMDCDDDVNKPLCSQMGVQGFPTLKIMRPGKKVGKPAVEDYNGARTATGIVEAVVDRINNHVKRVADKDLDAFLSDTEGPKALLFSEKGTTSALLKSIAIDYLGVLKVGQVRSKEKTTVEKFGIENYPTLILIPGGDKEPVVYDGEMKKAAMVEFLSQAASPNADPLAAGDKKAKKADKKTDTSSKSSKAKPKATTAEDTTSSADEPTETIKVPVMVESAIPISTIHASDKLTKECLNEKSTTCVLAFVPAAENEKAKRALDALAELAHKYSRTHRKLFPFFAVPDSNTASASLLKSLDVSGEVELIAVNAKRGWWRRYEGGDFSYENIESWVDAIRLSEGAKKKLPEGIVAAAVEEASSDASPEATSEATPDATKSVSSEEATPVTPEADIKSSATPDESTSTKGADPTPEAETAKGHDEL